ncbi:MAG: DUF4956 domain-containing protein [Lachnospiraceae bacterium]|nr:DUF4956 domain-containing protein [Lachnospiraceae bacterium]
MNIISKTIDNIFNSYSNQTLGTAQIVSVLLVVLVLALYEFVVYRVVSHRAFYNKSFNICIVILPFFIATIVMCLQSNIVITLGTIGALAILRFRTAVKDPVDMLYLLWSVHIGIVCGCQLYEIAVLTSLVVTMVLLLMNYVSLGRRPFVLVFQCEPEKDLEILNNIKEITSRFRIKSRNYTAKGMNYVIEFSVKDPTALTERLKGLEIEKFSVIEYDSEDVI